MPGSNWRPFACEANVITNYTNETALIVLIGENRHNGKYVDEHHGGCIIRIEWHSGDEWRNIGSPVRSAPLPPHNDSRVTFSRKTRCHS